MLAHFYACRWHSQAEILTAEPLQYASITIGSIPETPFILQMNPEPTSENARQAIVDSLAPLDFEGTAYDDLTRQAAEICEAEFAVISVVDGAKLQFRSRAGLDLLERPRVRSFCDHPMRSPLSRTPPPTPGSRRTPT